MNSINLKAAINKASSDLRKELDKLSVPAPVRHTKRYTISLIHGENAYSRVFTIKDGDFVDYDNLITELIVEAGFIDGEVRNAELYPCSMEFLMNPEVMTEYDIRGYYINYPGFIANDDRTSVTIPGNMIRISVFPKGGDPRRTKASWESRDDMMLHLSCIDQWEDSSQVREQLVDSINRAQNMVFILENVIQALKSKLIDYK